VSIARVLGYKGDTCEPWSVLAPGVRPVNCELVTLVTGSNLGRSSYIDIVQV
jgi:hypothetical protein